MVDITLNEDQPTPGNAEPSNRDFYIADGRHSRIDLNKVPVQALTRKAKELLSQSLDVIKITLSDNDMMRDWRGLAHCVMLTSDLVTDISQKCPHPTIEVLDRWAKQQSDQGQVATLGALQRHLGDIDRWDVVDDTDEFFCE